MTKFSISKNAFSSEAQFNTMALIVLPISLSRSYFFADQWYKYSMF